jgi:REP element-mobilizing transposase RayT
MTEPFPLIICPLSLASIQNEIEKLEPAERASLIDLLWDSLDEEHIRKLKPSGRRNPKIAMMRLNGRIYLLLMDTELESRLWPYLGGIARENRMKALAIGGTSDHVHALLSLSATLSFAKAVQLIKGGSSKWIHDTFAKYMKFGWQEGYGAFSVSVSQASRTIACINNQKEHHRKRTFEEEFLELLDKHNVQYDPRYVFDRTFSRPFHGLWVDLRP